MHLLKQINYLKSSESTEQQEEIRDEIKLILNELQVKIEQCTDIIAEVPPSASVRRISKSRSYYGTPKEQPPTNSLLRPSNLRNSLDKEPAVIPAGVLEVAGWFYFNFFSLCKYWKEKICLLNLMDLVILTLLLA